MKNIIKITCIAFAAITLLVLQGCVKDVRKNTYTYTYFEPVYKPLAQVLANIKSNPAKAVVNAGKICIKGSYIFLNEVNKGIHVIDNRNPAKPVNIAFIDVPGNVDLAVKGNTLYADFYADLLAIDITDPLHASVKNTVHHLFPERSYFNYTADSSMIITDWIKKTRTVDGPYPVMYPGGVLYNSVDAGFSLSNKATAAPVGINGSLSRFALIDKNLYCVGFDSLRIADVSVENKPVPAGVVGIGWGIETIFPMKDKLFIGSSSGMSIYSLQDPLHPEKVGLFEHVGSCDPVIADGDVAYVTLHGGTQCGGYSNQLDVLNVADIFSPALIKTYPLTSPRGLSKDGNLLFICDGSDGLKIFDAANPSLISLKFTFKTGEANDVIAYDHLAIVMAADGLYQYDYSDKSDIKYISKINFVNE